MIQGFSDLGEQKEISSSENYNSFFFTVTFSNSSIIEELEYISFNKKHI